MKNIMSNRWVNPNLRNRHKSKNYGVVDRLHPVLCNSCFSPLLGLVTPRKKYRQRILPWSLNQVYPTSMSSCS